MALDTRKQCTSCGAVIYTTSDEPICGPCVRKATGHEAVLPKFVGSINQQTWRTLRLGGWVLLVLSSITMLSLRYVNLSLVAILVAILIVAVSSLGVIWSSPKSPSASL